MFLLSTVDDIQANYINNIKLYGYVKQQICMFGQEDFTDNLRNACNKQIINMLPVEL